MKLCRSRTVLRAALAALATGALGLTTSGCSTSAPRALQPGRTYETTISAKTAAVRVYLDINAPRAITYIVAEGEADLSDGGCELSVQDAGVTTNELVTGNNLYFKVPPAARAATSGGKPWAEVELQSGSQRGPGVAPSSALTELDPAPLLELLALPPQRSTFAGNGTIGRQAVTEYRLDYPVAELSRPAPDGTLPAGLASLIAQLPHPSKASLPVYVWLDNRGRAVQLTASATLETEPASPSPFQAALANQLPATVSVRLDLGNFGEAVRLVPPVAAEVARVPLSELQAGLL